MLHLFYRLYSDYIYEARWKHYPISPSNFHGTVLDVIHRHEQCLRDYPIRACAYNNTIDPFKVGSLWIAFQAAGHYRPPAKRNLNSASLVG